MATCEYEERRRKNLEDNKRILAELGLANPYRLLPKVIKRGAKRPAGDENYEPKRKRSKVSAVPVDLNNSGSIRGSRRLSARIRGQVPGTECIVEDDKVEEDHEQSRVKYVMPDRPNWYGKVQGVAVGTIWATRMECCHDGIHRPPVAGIHGAPDGAFSIALSGGYEDDIDLGEGFTYTGEGGRDLKGTKNNPKNLRTAAQSRDQELWRGNLALSRNVATGNPVRVIRGYKLRSPFAPDEGYRYDGLYTVEKFWFTKGLSGHGVYKFALRRCEDQAPPPWELASEPASPSKSSDSGFSDAPKSDDGDSCDSKENKTGQRDDASDSGNDAVDEMDAVDIPLDEKVDSQNPNNKKGATVLSVGEKEEEKDASGEREISVPVQKKTVSDEIDANKMDPSVAAVKEKKDFENSYVEDSDVSKSVSDSEDNAAKNSGVGESDADSDCGDSGMVKDCVVAESKTSDINAGGLSDSGATD